MTSLKNRLLAIALLAVLAISSACRASGTQRQLADTLAASPSMHTPPADTGTGVEISAHSIGPIPVDSSLGAVAKLLPAYRVGTAYLEEIPIVTWRSEEHTSELQSPCNLVCRLLLEKKTCDAD